MKGRIRAPLLATGALFSKWAIPKPASANGRVDSASQASCDDPQVRSVPAVCVSEKFAYVRSPNVQRFSTFREELMPLIYGSDS